MKGVLMTEINPQESKRAEAYALWLHAPMPMLTFFKALDVTRLLRCSRRKGLKFNMLMCWCIGKAASGIEEFYTPPVGEKLIRYQCPRRISARCRKSPRRTHPTGA